jgi:hypothetical protein
MNSANRGLTVDTDKELTKMFKELSENPPPSLTLEMKESALEVFRRQVSFSHSVHNDLAAYNLYKTGQYNGRYYGLHWRLL